MAVLMILCLPLTLGGPGAVPSTGGGEKARPRLGAETQARLWLLCLSAVGDLQLLCSVSLVSNDDDNSKNLYLFP